MLFSLSEFTKRYVVIPYLLVILQYSSWLFPTLIHRPYPSNNNVVCLNTGVIGVEKIYSHLAYEKGPWKYEKCHCWCFLLFEIQKNQ